MKGTSKHDPYASSHSLSASSENAGTKSGSTQVSASEKQKRRLEEKIKQLRGIAPYRDEGKSFIAGIIDDAWKDVVYEPTAEQSVLNTKLEFLNEVAYRGSSVEAGRAIELCKPYLRDPRPDLRLSALSVVQAAVSGYSKYVSTASDMAVRLANDPSRSVQSGVLSLMRVVAIQDQNYAGVALNLAHQAIINDHHNHHMSAMGLHVAEGAAQHPEHVAEALGLAQWTMDNKGNNGDHVKRFALTVALTAGEKTRYPEQKRAALNLAHQATEGPYGHISSDTRVHLSANLKKLWGLVAYDARDEKYSHLQKLDLLKTVILGKKPDEVRAALGVCGSYLGDQNNRVFFSALRCLQHGLAEYKL